MVDAQIAPTESVRIICHSYLKSKQTGILKIFLNNFNGFRNVRKQALQSGPECTLGNLGLLILKKCDGSKYLDVSTCFYAFSNIPISLEIFNGNFITAEMKVYTHVHICCCV